MIRDDVKIIVTPTGVSLKEVLTKEVQYLRFFLSYLRQRRRDVG